MALARRPNGLRKNTGGCRISTKTFSPNGLKREWHHIPKNSLSLRAEMQKAGRLGLPGLVATGGTETTIAGRRSAGNGEESFNPFSPNGLKRGWHHIPLKPTLSEG